MQKEGERGLFARSHFPLLPQEHSQRSSMHWPTVVVALIAVLAVPGRADLSVAGSAAAQKQPPHSTKFAYVSMLAYPSTPERRDYLISFLVATESIRRTGSSYDVVAMVYGLLSVEDEELLVAEGVKVKRVLSVGSGLESNPEAFDEQSAAVYRAKTRVLELVEYEMVLFFDSDVIFHENCDDLFESDNAFIGRTGGNSPFNAGLYLVRPSLKAMREVEEIALSGRFDVTTGWMDYGPIPDWRSNEEGKTTDWSFYGASVEQGLLYYYFMCKKAGGDAVLMSMYKWDDRATHFTGNNKPFAAQKKTSSVAAQRYGSAQSQWLGLHEDLQARLMSARKLPQEESISDSQTVSADEDLVSCRSLPNTLAFNIPITECSCSPNG